MSGLNKHDWQCILSHLAPNKYLTRVTVSVFTAFASLPLLYELTPRISAFVKSVVQPNFSAVLISLQSLRFSYLIESSVNQNDRA